MKQKTRCARLVLWSSYERRGQLAPFKHFRQSRRSFTRNLTQQTKKWTSWTGISCCVASVFRKRENLEARTFLKVFGYRWSSHRRNCARATGILSLFFEIISLPLISHDNRWHLSNMLKPWERLSQQRTSANDVKLTLAWRYNAS